VPRFPDKQKVLAQVIEQLSSTVSALVSHVQTIREGATHEEAKPENDKDTRALEQSYLARGQALRAEEVVEQVHVLRYLPLAQFKAGDPISTGALVEIESDEATRCLFVLPHGGGIEVHVDDVEVQVVTPTSPLGKALLGRTVGDDFQIRMRGAMREYVIEAIG
jgi:transcription elongation GreA/GreB family factor